MLGFLLVVQGSRGILECILFTMGEMEEMGEPAQSPCLIPQADCQRIRRGDLHVSTRVTPEGINLALVVGH